MKRICILGVPLACSLALAFTGPAQAQSPGTKVAVVNVADVFMRYDKAKAFKAEVEKMISPHKAEAETLKKQIMEWQTAVKHPKFDPKDLERYEQAMVANQRKLEDLSRLVAAQVGKIQEGQVVTLFKDLNMATEAVAKSQGFQLVLAHAVLPGEPLTLDSIQRKMSGMDLGSTQPQFFLGSTDITEQVVQSLNNYFRTTAGGGAPATVPGATTGLTRPGM